MKVLLSNSIRDFLSKCYFYSTLLRLYRRKEFQCKTIYDNSQYVSILWGGGGDTSCTPNSQAEVSHPVCCPRLFIQYVGQLPPVSRENFIHITGPHSACHGDMSQCIHDTSDIAMEGFTSCINIAIFQ
jgi:hypothetical protein